MTLGRCELALTAKSLCFVNWASVDEAFDFVFGDKICQVHSVLAEFLSPKVSRLRRCDPLCDVYTFSKDNQDLFDIFEILVSSLRSGVAFEIEGSNFGALFRLCQELENAELLSSLFGIINSDSLSIEDAVVLLRAGIKCGAVFSDPLSSLRDGLAYRFYDIKKEILDDLEVETLQILLSSPSLRITDEDSLYNFVRSRSENDVRYASLFEFIQFEYLSVNSIEDFASFAPEYLLDNITSGIWTRICGRLIQDAKRKTNPRVPIPPFVCDQSKPLDGIIAYLTRECGGNVHDKQIVKVKASDYSDTTHPPRNVVDLGTSSGYISNAEEAWICYDFKKQRVIPTSYSLNGLWCDLTFWAIDVSNDGTEDSWTEIDHRHNNDLTSTQTRSFAISDIPSQSVRFVRVRMTRKKVATSGAWVPQRWPQIVLNSFELFGSLYGR